MHVRVNTESLCSRIIGPESKCCLWLFQDNKADVILKYNLDEARSLKAYGELPDHGELRHTRPRLDGPTLRWTALINIPLSTAKINEDNFGPEDDEIQFDDCGYGDDDDVDEVSSFDLSCPGPFDVWV